MSKRYPIDTLINMSKIPEEARERFLAELPYVLAQMAAFFDACEIVGGVLDSLETKSLIWVDDDANTTQVTVNGEVMAKVRLNDKEPMK